MSEEVQCKEETQGRQGLVPAPATWGALWQGLVPAPASWAPPPPWQGLVPAPASWGGGRARSKGVSGTCRRGSRRNPQIPIHKSKSEDRASPWVQSRSLQHPEGRRWAGPEQLR